jgi:3-oxoacyl-[acyl-carrier-protein] synthase II
MIDARSPSTAPVVTGAAVVSALGRGEEPLVDAALAGEAAFAPVRRFDVSGRRVGVAATMDGAPDLRAELVGVVRDACARSGLSADQALGAPLLLAIHCHPDLTRGAAPGAEALAAEIAATTGLSPAVRAYPSACVAASTAVADAAAMVHLGRASTVVVAAGYLVEPDQFALFDAGRALATDGQVRPFSAGRTGLLLGDGVAAIVVESAESARHRDAPILGRLAGWGRAGDSYHVCLPHPQGTGLARAMRAALDRGRVNADEVGYVNAHGSGTPHSDTAEAAALARALGPYAGQVPVSSTKSVHGQSLEASALVELIITLAAVRRGFLPVNAGFLGPDDRCPLDLIVGSPREVRPRYALSLNSAFGGANTALLIGAT